MRLLLLLVAAAWAAPKTSASQKAEPVPPFPAGCEHVYGALLPCRFNCAPSREEFWRPPQYFCDLYVSNDHNNLNKLDDEKDLAKQRSLLETVAKNADGIYGLFRRSVDE